jgi:hypothetical protein
MHSGDREGLEDPETHTQYKMYGWKYHQQDRLGGAAWLISR